MKFLTEHTGQRLRNLLDRSGAAPTGKQAGSGRWPGRDPVLVRCTSTTPADGSGIGADCYPGVIVAADATETAADQPDLGDVWLTLLDAEDGAAVPAEGQVYLCVLAGAFDPDPEGDSDPRPRAFGVPVSPDALTVEEVDGSPSVPDVTTLRFDQADGFVVTNPAPGVARIDLPDFFQHPVCFDFLSDVDITATCNEDGTITLNVTKYFKSYTGYGVVSDDPC